MHMKDVIHECYRQRIISAADTAIIMRGILEGGQSRGVKSSDRLAVNFPLIVLLVLATMGCVGEQTKPGPTEEAASVSEAPIGERVPREMLSEIALKDSDFKAEGWVPAVHNMSGDTYEIRFFRTEFGFGEMSRIVNKVHYYESPEDAKRDFGDALSALSGEVTVKEAGIGEESASWEKLNEAYILFIDKNIAVELYLKTKGTENLEFLKGLARSIENRI